MTSLRDDSEWNEGNAAGTAVAPRLGADLRAARERLGWTLPAIAEHLRIRLPFLDAIEQGRVQDLPGTAYAIGFIRTYAQALGLDPAEAARRFRQEIGEGGQKTELDFPTPVPERGVPVLAVVLIGTLIVVGAYIGWFRMSGNNHPTADLVQQVPPRLEPLVQDKPATSAAPAAGPSRLPVQAPPQTALATQTQGTPPGIQLPSTQPEAMPSQGVQPEAPGMATPPQTVSPSSAAAATTYRLPDEPARAPDGTGLVLRATADSWMQVRQRSGPVLLNRVLRAGETWPVPADKPALLLSTGNAGGTQLVLNGVPGAPLGADGAIRRDVPLGADVGKGGKPVISSGPARRTVLPHNQ